MNARQWILLLASVIGGAFWTFVVQDFLFLNLFPGLLVGPGLDLQDYLQNGSSPSFTMLWISCLTALLIWFWRTSSRRAANSAAVRGMRPQWWLAASLLVLLGWLYLLVFTVFIWQVRGQSPIEGSGLTAYPIPPVGWILLMGFVLLDGILLFWLPTVLASPRSYRLVVPGAVTLFARR